MALAVTGPPAEARLRPGRGGLPPSRQCRPNGRRERCRGRRSLVLGPQLSQQRPRTPARTSPLPAVAIHGVASAWLKKPPYGGRDQCRGALEQHGGTGQPGCLTRRGERASSTRCGPSRPYRVSRAASSPACGVRTSFGKLAGQGGQGAGVGDDGKAPWRRPRGPVPAVRAAPSSRREPSKPGLDVGVGAGALRGCRRPPGRRAGPGRRPRAGPSTAPCRFRRRGRPGRPTPRPRDSGQSRPQHRGRPGSTCGAPFGAGQQPGQVTGCQPAQVRLRQMGLDPDRDQLHASGKSAPGSVSSPVWRPQRSPSGRPRRTGAWGYAGVGIDAAGNIARDHQSGTDRSRSRIRSAAAPLSPPCAPVPSTASMTTSARRAAGGRFRNVLRSQAEYLSARLFKAVRPPGVGVLRR